MAYKVYFKNWKTDEWIYCGKYKTKTEISEKYKITIPTIRSIIKESEGIYSKFFKISEYNI